MTRVWRWYWAFLLLNLVDWVCTVFEVHHIGQDVEANPFMASSMAMFGPTLGLGINKVVGFAALAGGLVVVTRAKPSLPLRQLLMFGTLVFGGVALWHVFILFNVATHT